MTPDTDLILTTNTGPVRTLSLNRPAVRNALSAALRDALFQAVETARDDPAVRAIILTGEGTAFCAGLDLTALQGISSRSSEHNRSDALALGDLLELIYTLPKPVVAAVNGPAVAGGAGLASVCDVVIMADSARLGYTEARIGFVAALVGVFLVRQIGERWARDLLLSARLINARKALEIGLVNEVCHPEALLTRAQEIAQNLALNAPSSLALTKSLLATTAGMGIHDALRYAAELNALARSTDDLKEGVTAFLERRQPRWDKG